MGAHREVRLLLEVRPDAPSPILRRGSRRPGHGGLPGSDTCDHRCRKGRMGRFPANSEAAVAASLYLDEAAIEVDVFLTNDRVPVLVDGHDWTETPAEPSMATRSAMTSGCSRTTSSTYMTPSMRAPTPEWPDARVGQPRSTPSRRSWNRSRPTRRGPCCSTSDGRPTSPMTRTCSQRSSSVGGRRRRPPRRGPPTARMLQAGIACEEVGQDVVTLLLYYEREARAERRDDAVQDVGLADPWMRSRRPADGLAHAGARTGRRGGPARRGGDRPPGRGRRTRRRRMARRHGQGADATGGIE